MDFKQLQAFVLLAEHLHFANTAEQLHITASALTRSIQRLEDEVGQPLLLRSNRQVLLTSQGQQFLSFAKSVLDKHSEMQHQMQQQAEKIAGRLRIYSSVTASYSILSPVLQRFRQSFPDVDVKLHTGDQAEALKRLGQKKDDLVVAALPDALPKDLLFKTLMFSRLVFIAPKDTSSFDALLQDYLDNPQPSCLAGLPWILSEQGLVRERLSGWFDEHQQDLNIYAEVSGHEAIVSMVALGMGVGVVPEIVIEHSPLRDKIEPLTFAPELKAFQIGLCALKTQLKVAAVDAFWQIA